MKTLRKTEINVILSQEFDKLLQSLGVWEDFEAGKYSCVACGDRLNRENARIVFPLSENDIGFVCQKPECMAKYRSREGT